MKTFSALVGAALLMLAMMMALPSTAAAQTISQTTGAFNPGLNSGWGQSFTATVTGTVTQIRVRSQAGNTTTLRIYNGAAGSGLPGNAAGSIYSQSVTLTDSASNTVGFTTIALTTPLPITAGSEYTFILDSADLSYAADAYAGGVLVENFGNPTAPLDLAFEVVQVMPAAVPTLSEWAMILFALLLAGGAALYIQRGRQVV